MSKLLKTGLWVAGLVIYLLFCSISWQVLPAPGVFMSPNEGFWQNAPMQSSPATTLPDVPVSKEVDVVFDESGTPHIFAQSAEDAALVLGYLHARDRLFQMDFSYRAATGRLSEILGMRSLEYDLEMRRKGMGIMAENIAAFWNEDADHYHTHILPYMKGVNHYIKNLNRRDYPIEFKLLDYRPEKWDEFKMASVVAFLNHQLTFRHEDIAATQTRELLGEEMFERLFPAFYEDIPPVVPDKVANRDAQLGSVGNNDHPVESNFSNKEGFHRHFAQPSSFLGSNNWVVSPQRTEDGSLFLANDPHLPLTLPSIWYECHMVSPGSNQYGFSLPGIPLIYIGINEHFAVGTTNVGMDYLDYYEIHWEDEERKSYVVDDEVKKVEWREERIGVRGREDYVDSMAVTLFGQMPFYRDEENPMSNYAMRWAATMPSKDHMKALVKKQYADNIDDFQKAVQEFSGPPQNIVYGDKHGNIGLFVVGSLPDRRDAMDGRFLRDGSTMESLLDATIPRDSMPKLINPASGFVASANQQTAGADFPYPMLGNYNLDRGTYLYHYLDTASNIDLERMKRLQNDNRSQKALEICAGLLPLLDTTNMTPVEIRYYELLTSWDHTFEPNSIEAVFFKIWQRDWLSRSWDRVFTEVGLLRPNWKTTLSLIVNSDSVPEEEEEILTELKAAIAKAFSHATKETAEWEEKNGGDYWVKFRNSYIQHIARIEAFGEYELHTGGTRSALNSIFDDKGPSLRMIAQFNGEERRFFTSLPGGRSGNPGNRLYDSGLKYWLEGNYREVYLGDNPDPLLENASGRLIIGRD